MKTDGPVTAPFAYFGTPYVARDTLAILLASGYRPRVVITSPDAPRGRGLAVTPSETRILAEAEDIPVLTPSKLDDTFIRKLIDTYACQYAIVVAYGKLLPQALLDAFPLGVLNVHYSLLPKYRGASPVESALLSGDAETGVTIQRMVLKMDAGDILAQRVVSIEEGETLSQLRARLIEIGAQLLVETLPLFISGSIALTPQDETLVTFAPKIQKKDACLSLKDDPDINWRKYRAYHESPGTYFYASKGDKRIRVRVVKASCKDHVFTIERIVPESRSEQDFSMLVEGGWVAE